MRHVSSNKASPADTPAVAGSAKSPAWFRQAIADAPERSTLNVDGTGIEVLAWGDRGRPGLLLLHGFTAHADWWSFIAPLLRRDRRVVAFSFSGMGRSGWRETYTVEQYASEALAVADATGLFAAPKPPILVAHSFGTYVARTVARNYADRLGGLILVDGILTSEKSDDRYDGAPPSRGHRHRLYPDLKSALARFRFSPPQPCENTYIAEFIARRSLEAVSDDAGASGWSWCFDPDLRAKLDPLPFAELRTPPACRVSLMFGERSSLLTPARIDTLRRSASDGTPWIEVPDAGHHVMVDQPLALVTALRTQVETWQPSIVTVSP
jgi:pimeloyl-ACP methyl ester carboxylesterase